MRPGPARSSARERWATSLIDGGKRFEDAGLENQSAELALHAFTTAFVARMTFSRSAPSGNLDVGIGEDSRLQTSRTLAIVRLGINTI